MLENPQVLDVPAQTAAVIHLVVPRAQIQEVMGPGLSELRRTLEAQGVKPAGAWFTHHLRMSPDEFDFELGIPVTTKVQESGRVKPGQLPAARVARTTYRGGYEGLAAAWPEFDAWIAARGHTPLGDLWETYLAGPESGGDPAQWRTEFTRPLK